MDMNDWNCIYTPKESKTNQQEDVEEKPKCLLDASIFT